MNIRKLLLLATTILSLSVANAGEIHKWRDKDGRLHFGDQQNAPKGSQVILNSTNANNNQATPAETGSQDKSSGPQSGPASISPAAPYTGNAPYEKGAPAGIAPEKLTQCIAMVREHFKQENSASEIRAFFVKLESVCPKTGFICRSYKWSPQKDHCEPVRYKDGQNQVNHQVYNS
jgi:hypothetical protein